MAQLQIDIDRLVREVLEQLQGARPESSARAPAAACGSGSASGNGQPEPPLGASPGAGCLAPVGTPSNEPTPQSPGNDQSAPQTTSNRQEPQPPEGQVTVDSRVVTMAELGNRLGSARTLVVRPGAVVTPSVRDHLRRERIQLVEAALETSESAPNAKSVVPIVVNARSFETGPLADGLRRDGLHVDLQRCDCLIESTDRLAGTAADRRVGVLLTRHQAAALCLANRHPGVRAVAADEPGALQAAVEAVGANVVVCNPRQIGMYRLRQMIGEFIRRGPTDCPEVFRNRLG